MLQFRFFWLAGKVVGLKIQYPFEPPAFFDADQRIVTFSRANRASPNDAGRGR